MAKLTIIFLAIAWMAGIFAFTDLGVAVPIISEYIYLIFLVLFLITLLGWFLAHRREQNYKQ